MMSFLKQTVKDFGYGVDSILIDSADTPKLYAFPEDVNIMPSSVSSEFLYSVHTLVILDSSLL